jgi:RimJ/RimL family protein N-acetyltransferase/anti-anti-sigma regulatory factor
MARDRHDATPDGSGHATTGDALGITVGEALTLGEADRFCRALEPMLAGSGRRVWIDLEDVKAVDVVGVAALHQGLRRASARGVPVTVLPSPTVYRALLNAGILEDVPYLGPEAAPTVTAPVVIDAEPETRAASVAATAQLSLRRPRWEELAIFARWAQEPLLDQMVGSQLLYLCRHLGPYHPDFVARVLNDAGAVTLFVEPRGSDGRPVGFVRLYGVNLTERFAFLETAIVEPGSRRDGRGVQAARLFVAWAQDVLELHRVEAKVYAYNVPSLNALRRNGFRQEGVLREARTFEGRRWDIVVYSILGPEMMQERARDGFSAMGLWQRRADP